MQDSQMQTESPYTQFRLHRQPQALDNRFLLFLKSILSKPRLLRSGRREWVVATKPGTKERARTEE